MAVPKQDAVFLHPGLKISGNEGAQTAYEAGEKINGGIYGER
ncbi:hypothetical protein [Geomonas subterranea]|nr:hypothetical protein [Geomonas fuzhouensis]